MRTPEPNSPASDSPSPIASVIVPAYNAEQYIAATLASILHQDLGEIEVIVVNDGSSDSTADVVRSIGDSRIQLINADHSGGPSTPRNIGLRRARGQFLFLFDSDDIMLPGKLRHSLDAFSAAPNAGILFTNFEQIDATGHVLSEDFLATYETLYSLPFQQVNSSARLISGSDLLVGLAKANFIGTSSVLLRRSAIEATGLFDPELKNGDDYDYWVRITSRFDGVFLDHKLHQYRYHTASISGSRPIRRLRNLTGLFEKHANSVELPGWFRHQSHQKWLRHALSLSRECLKAGIPVVARSSAVEIIKTRPWSVTAYLLLFLSWLPDGIREKMVDILRVIRRVAR